MQQFGTFTFYIYFKVVYDGMKEKNIENTYFGLLFPENCMISVDPETKQIKEPLVDKTMPFFAD